MALLMEGPKVALASPCAILLAHKIYILVKIYRKSMNFGGRISIPKAVLVDFS